MSTAVQMAVEIATLREELSKWKSAERELSNAYLRIRRLLNAWDTAPGGTDRYAVTERALSELIAENTRLQEVSRCPVFWARTNRCVRPAFHKEPHLTDKGFDWRT